jgi:predicted RNA binding protein YcfA (HicA-like mRNA interferase family)
MTRHSKTLERLTTKPTPANFKWADLVSVLQHLGFEQIKNTGSRRKFFHQGKNVLISCHEPHPSPNVDKGCINDIVDTLKNTGFIPP